MPIICRLCYICWITWRYNLADILIPKKYYYRPIRWAQYLNPWYWQQYRTCPPGVRLQEALAKLGPIFVKIGQILSTRLDLLPSDIIKELAQLQDQVPPFAGTVAKAIVAQQLQCDLTTVFKHFNEQPLAAASIAQVHEAILHDGTAVVVKVLRPQIKYQLKRDLRLMRIIARILTILIPGMATFKPQEIITEIGHTLYAELDLLLEGANAAQLARNFRDSSCVHIPAIYWHYSTAKALVMEQIHGISIQDHPQLQQAGLALSAIAQLAIEIFFTQVLRDNFFHADWHPGNIFINKNQHGQAQYSLVDFGIVGSLSSNDQRYLAANILALIKKDYRRVAELHLASAWLPANARTDLFAAELRAICEPAFALPLHKLSLAQLLFRLFGTARKFHINIQPQLILLQKSLLSIESLARNLDPDIELLAAATPHIHKWLHQQLGITHYIKNTKDNISALLYNLPSAAQTWIQTMHKHNTHSSQVVAQPKLIAISIIIGSGLISGTLLWLNYMTHYL